VRLRLGAEKGDRPRLLEIGCGLGHFLDAAHDAGFDVEGVEFNRWAWEYIRGKYRFPVHFGGVLDVSLDEGVYDVCCLLDVIEHLPDPDAVVRKVASWLRPGGICLIETMDAASFVSRLLGKRLEDFRRIREHLYFFNRPTIKRFLVDRGLSVRRIESVGHSFPLNFLLDRLDLIVPRVFAALKRLIRPQWLLRTTLYVNPGTKMLVLAQKENGES
jgi:SAM-dependent methyltransferase